MADIDIQVTNLGNVEEVDGKGDIDLYDIKYTSKSEKIYDMIGFHVKNAFGFKNDFVIVDGNSNLNKGKDFIEDYCLWVRFRKHKNAVIEYVNKHPVCGRSNMPEKGTGAMMMNISQYILEMFGVKESSLQDMAGIEIEGREILTRKIFTLTTGQPWYSRWGIFQ
jgi:hypothetical protein